MPQDAIGLFGAFLNPGFWGKVAVTIGFAIYAIGMCVDARDKAKEEDRKRDEAWKKWREQNNTNV